MQLRLDASQLVGLTELWRRAPELMREELLPAVVEADLLLRGELQRDLPKGVGGLQGAGLMGGIFTEESVLADNVIGMVASNSPHAEYVEIGTAPRELLPPYQPIYEWVRAKLGLDDEEAKGATFAIRRSIQQRGTRPQPVWKRTLDAKQMEVLVKIAQGVERVLARLGPGGVPA